MSNVVKFMHGEMVGAPTVYGNAGGLLSMLDACLKDGWGQQTASSVVVAGGIATVTFGTAFPAEIQSCILVAGATPSGLNGEKKVLSLTSSTLTFDATGISDQTATGTITVKMAPLGWIKPFSGTNLAVYTSPASAFTGGYLRVDDTGTLNARVVAYEGMYDVNTGLNPYPTNTQVSGGLYWPKSQSADATARKWLLAGDDRGFYLWLAPNNGFASGLNGFTVYFGDPITRNTADKFPSVLTGATSSIVASTSAQGACMGYSNLNGTPGGVYVARAPTALVGGVSSAKSCLLAAALADYSGRQLNNTGWLNFSNPGDNGLLLGQTGLFGSSSLRGWFPGWYMSPQLLYSYILHRDPVPGTDDFPNKRFLALRHAGPADNFSVYGFTFLDVTGPWR
ncbi:hypothetical protein [Cupriavidus necator]|uniref:hypothetical protein n=1 Tax=Cupriavidus necator TaxID=106590 RepID=UPI00339DA84A